MSCRPQETSEPASQARIRLEDVLTDERSLVELLRVVTVDVHEANSVDEALHRTIANICAYVGWPVGHAYIPAQGNDSLLVPTALWHIRDEAKFAAFKRVTEVTQFMAGRGLPGRVFATKRPAWIRNVVEDPNFPRAKLAKNLGVKAGFAFPVMVGAEVVAVLEFFSDTEYEANDRFTETISRIAWQLGRVFERKRAQEMLSKERDFMAAVMDLVDGLIVVLDPEGRIVRMNGATELALGGAIGGGGAEPRFLWDLTPDPEASARLKGLLKQLGAGASVQQVEVPWTAPDGTRWVTAWSGAVLRGPAGDIEHLIMTGIDLTERKRAEEERARLQEEVIRAQDAAIAKLSMPLIPISEDVVVLPLMGPLDAERVRRMIESVARGIGERRTRIVIVDMTGVDRMDTQASQALLEVVQVAALLGTRVVLTGIRPEVAQRLVAGGADMRRVAVRSSLQRGIAFAMEGR